MLATPAHPATLTGRFARVGAQDGCGVDSFTCTDSIPNVVQWLQAEGKARQEAGLPAKAFVMPLAPLIADWIQANPADNAARRKRQSITSQMSVSAPDTEVKAGAMAGALAGALAGAVVGALAAACVIGGRKR